MKKYLDHTFFKFLFGFVTILVVSFVLLAAVGYYQVEIKPDTHASVDLGDAE